jgi:hypothetical protein
MAGRRTKRTADTAKRFCDAIRLGATYDLAARYAGMSDSTFERWRESDPDFAEQVRDAEGAAVVGWLAKIEKAANDGEWTAAAWKLERRYPHEYGRRVVDANVSATVTVKGYSVVSPDDWDKPAED